MNSQLMLSRHNKNHPRTHPETHSGTSLAVQRTVNDDPYATLTIDGKSEQVQISRGDNLFDGLMENGGIDLTTGALTVSSSLKRSVNYMPIGANVTFTLSKQFTDVIRFFFYNGATLLSNNGPYSGTVTLTTPANTTSMKFIIGGNRDTTNTMIVLGSVAKAYAAFVGESPSLLYPSTINSTSNFDLVSADGTGRMKTIHFSGTYGSLPSGVCDQIAVNNFSEITKSIKRKADLVLTGNRTWTLSQSLNGYSRFYTFIGAKVGTSNALVNVWCDKLKGVSWNEPTKMTSNNIHSYGGDSRIGITISNSFTGILDADTTQQKVDKLVAYLNTNNLYIQFEVDPTETVLSHEAVNTFFDITNVYTNAAVQPMLTGTYRVLGV